VQSHIDQFILNSELGLVSERKQPSNFEKEKKLLDGFLEGKECVQLEWKIRELRGGCLNEGELWDERE